MDQVSRGTHLDRVVSTPDYHVSRTSQQRHVLAEGATELVLIRHGSAEVATSVHPRLRQSDPELNPLGLHQAAQVARRLAHAPPDTIFCSPLRRARATADEVARACGLPVVEHDGLREVGLGEWELDFEHRLAGREEVAVQIIETARWELAPGGEPATAFCARLRAAVADLVASTGPGRTSVAVSHAGAIAEICRLATDARPRAFRTIENASITRLMVTASGEWRLLSFNDTAHLDALPRAPRNDVGVTETTLGP